MSDDYKPSIMPPEPPEPERKSMGDKTSNILTRLGKALLTVLKLILTPVLAIVNKLFDIVTMPLPKGPKESMRNNRNIILIVVGVIVALIFMRGCVVKNNKQPSLSEIIAQESKRVEGPIPVKGFKVGRFNYEDSLNELGTIKGAVDFKLSFEIPGVISSINYREGEHYEEGALLVSLRQDDILLRLKRAQAAHKKSKAQATIQEEKVKEHEKLFEMGAIPKTTLDKVKLEYDSSNFEAEEARLEVKANEAMLEKSNLYAPSSGMIGELNVEEGEAITPNTLLGKHLMTEYVYSEIGVVERDINKIALGQKARVFVDAYPNKTFDGVIESISKSSGGTSRTFDTKIRVENPEGELLPGMFSRVRILLYSKKNTLVVPTDSVQGGEGEQFIFVLDPDRSVAEKRAITVGYTRPDYTQIDAGVSEGELVAISAIERLEDGKPIKLLETQEAEI